LFSREKEANFELKMFSFISDCSHLAPIFTTELNYELGQGAVSVVHKAELLDAQNNHELIADIFHSMVSELLTQEFENANKNSLSTLIDKELNASFTLN